jgi:2-C-methyl-D-erythritol 4-phosphate cytidylyltransferase
VAGGAGLRMGNQTPKQFLPLAETPILVHTINAFGNALPQGGIVVVLPAEHQALWNNICKTHSVAPHIVATGGATRFDSVASGLRAVPAEATLIAVHDGVRPFASAELIARCFAEADKYGSAIPAVAPVDSFRSVGAEGDSTIVNRDTLRAIQTPQVFRAETLRNAYSQSGEAKGFTDDASVVEATGGKVHLTEGERSNIKITTPVDMLLGEAIIKSPK